MFIRAGCVILFVCEAVHCGMIHRRSTYVTQPGDFDWNNVADNIIHLIKGDIVQQDKAEVSLPDVYVEDTFSMAFTNVRYILRAREGTVGKITSFRRSGDVALSKDSVDTLQGVVPLTSDRLQVRYGSYNLKVLWFNINGVLEGSMENVSFLMTVFGYEVGQGCATSLIDVKVVDLGSLDVNITGFGGFNHVISAIVRLFFSESRRMSILSSIERVLLKQLSKMFEEYECDQLHSLFLLGGAL